MTKYANEHFIEYIIIFCFGGFIYSLIEVISRGYTHWTMWVTGGVVFSLLYLLNISLKTRSLVLRGLLGCIIITFFEFIVGVLVNLIFKMNVWDYSAHYGNVLGQICPAFSLCWFFLSLVCVYLSIFLHWQLNKKMCIHQDFD